MASTLIVRYTREGIPLDDEKAKAALKLLVQRRRAQALAEEEAEEARERQEREMAALRLAMERQRHHEAIVVRDKAIIHLQRDYSKLQSQLLAGAVAVPPAPTSPVLPSTPLLSCRVPTVHKPA
jgi:hypothetical protein